MSTAFISRVSRSEKGQPRELVPGPGAYDDPRRIKLQLPGFAPFSGTAKRNLGDDVVVSEVPPPGTYQIEGSLLTQSSVASTQFKSKVERFRDSVDTSIPGPSTYMLPSTLKATKKKRAPPKPAVNVVQELIAPTLGPRVPSIPTKFQGYGYEPTDSGVLLPQDPLNPGFSGLSGDSVGPGDYNPNDSVKFHGSTSVDFTKYARRETIFSSVKNLHAEGPGPGQYNVSSSFDAYDKRNPNREADFTVRLNEPRQRQSAAFESRTIRDALGPDIRSKIAPGPLYYNIPSTIQAPEPKPNGLQCFSTSVPRFQEERTRANRIYTSPGDYTPLTSDFDKLKLKILKKKKMASNSGWAQNIAFAATEKRFVDPRVLAPPPGTYSPKTAIADHIPRENSRLGAFGMKSQRFKEPKPEPGPAEDVRAAENVQMSLIRGGMDITSSSAEKNRMNPARRTRMYGVFASKGERFPLESQDPGPPPGKYHVSLSWEAPGAVPMVPKHVPLVRKAPEETPGPGQYPLPGSVSVKHKSRKDIMYNTSPRSSLIPYHQREMPGPGEYNLSKTLVKSSHNVYLSEDDYSRMGGGVSSISAADDRAGKNSPEFVFAFQVLRQENEMGVKLNWNGVGKKDRDRDVFEHLKDTFIKAKEEYLAPLNKCLCPAVIRAKYKLMLPEERLRFHQAVVSAAVVQEKLQTRRQSLTSISSARRNSTSSASNDKADPMLRRAPIRYAFEEEALREVGMWQRYRGPDGVKYVHVLTKDIVDEKPIDFINDPDGNEAVDEDGDPELMHQRLDPSNGLPVVEMVDLPKEVEKVIKEMNETPLIIDTSEEQGARTYYKYRGVLEDVTVLVKPGVKASDVVENCRKSIVRAMKLGKPFVMYIGNICSDHKVDWKNNLCKKDVFPIDCFANGGQKLSLPYSEPRFKALFRPEDVDQGSEPEIQEGFQVIVITTLSAYEFKLKLEQSIPLGYMHPVYVNRPKDEFFATRMALE